MIIAVEFENKRAYREYIAGITKHSQWKSDVREIIQIVSANPSVGTQSKDLSKFHIHPLNRNPDSEFSKIGARGASLSADKNKFPQASTKNRVIFTITALEKYQRFYHHRKKNDKAEIKITLPSEVQQLKLGSFIANEHYFMTIYAVGGHYDQKSKNTSSGFQDLSWLDDAFSVGSLNE